MDPVGRFVAATGRNVGLLTAGLDVLGRGRPALVAPLPQCFDGEDCQKPLWW
jgi:hypothetical protein